MARLFSGKVFDRASRVKCSQRLAAGLEELTRDVEPSRKAVGVNVEADWRVTPEREIFFCASIEKSERQKEKPEDVLAMLYEFYYKHVRRVPNPDFLAEHNKLNRRSEIDRATLLVNVLRFPQGNDAIEPGAVEVGLGGTLTHRGAVDVLEEVFPPANTAKWDRPLDDRQMRFLEKCFQREAKPNYHPVWSCFWDDLSPYVELGPDFWLSAVGVRSSGKRLCLLFRYDIKAIGGPPFIPSCLEANDCPEHFPSPPPTCDFKELQGCLPVGGHPVSLHADTERDPMPQEFIHQDFVREPKMVVAWGWTDALFSAKPLGVAREHHYSRLIKNYSHIKKWLQEPV